MINTEVGRDDLNTVALMKTQCDTNFKRVKNNRYIEQACLLSNSRMKFTLVNDTETKKLMIDLRHLNKNKLTKRGVRLGVEEFREILTVPRLDELLTFYSDAVKI